MRSAVVTFVVAAIAIGMGSAGAAQRPPVMRVARLDPVTVQGARFRARERVRVTYTGSVRRTRVVVTSQSGSFSARFTGVTDDPCTGFSLSALGASGDRATARHKPLPACPPA